ncbi:uncharacterized protein LOC125717864 isoform X2 [Brienomyrus brachyistius]|nr:uncharacterized protein LOC125717864 isoform X2 [Brienomyrus brachyistius]XP_048847174.1 uncharacterized protein LOC125717864 isoform X2 [Brienomyrus brachyistius]
MKPLVPNDMKIRQNLLNSSKVFIKESLKFIKSVMTKTNLSQERGRRYIKEILHSIFFIGYINKPPINPRDILETDLHSKLFEKFPDVFQLYETQLPRRPPFSVLLEVVVETTGDRSVTAILEVLQKLNDDMIIRRSEGNFCGNDFCFGATVVSCSYFQRGGQKTQNYFGASVSCKGRKATRIFICLACIETWNDNVTHAVCLAAEHHRSIRLPDAVYSMAYQVCRVREGENYSHMYTPLLPCSLCQNIFQNVTFSPPATAGQDKASWNYGNCAECEAISNLLNGEITVNEEAQQLNARLMPSLRTLRGHRKQRLRDHLNEHNFNVIPVTTFYNP